VSDRSTAVEALGEVVAGRDLTEAAAHGLMGELMSGALDPAVIGALLAALRSKGETSEEIAGFVRGMLDAATRLPLTEAVAARAIDTCGTGGDGAGTINVSTIAALVVAAAGVPVVKHGNRAASSLSGSADLLEAWGVAIDLGPAAAASVLDEVGVTFLFARRYHPAMRHVAPVRSALGMRTVFNLLGPLSNPAGVRRQVVGVPDEGVGELVASALARLGHTRALVVHGADGLDELTTTTTSRVWDVRDGAVTEWTLEPSSLGIAPATTAQLRGGDVARNRALADAILAGESGPRADLVALNAAAALVVAGVTEDLGSGLEVARASLASGAAREVLERWVDASQRALVRETAEASTGG
jgi:anthranilate phosphoribosyltransferase